MQSICLEVLGGENKVDPSLQETTFIQHTFGGNLRSKVLIILELYDLSKLYCFYIFFPHDKHESQILLHTGQMSEMSA